MAFFKTIWRNSSKHKKLSEEWALAATSLRDLSELQENMDVESGEAMTFNLKYLGDTIIEEARSKEATADAVKNVISTSKAGGKKLQRVSVSVSPKGIEVNDQVTGETLHQISIYRISYCSADANYGNVFAFVSSSNLDFSDSYDLNISDPSSSSSTSSSTSPSPVPDGPLVCHVFLCPKRKIAQAMAMTVAKSFERAFEIWKLVSHRRSVHQQRPRCAQKNPFPSSNQPMAISDDVEKKAEEEKMVSLLIDFNAELTSELCSKDGRSYLQNTWVSFDEHHENAMSNLHKNASWGSNTLCS